MIVLFFWFIK